MKLPLPKRGITPRELYLQYIPELWATLVGPAKGLPAVTVAVLVDGGGSYALSVSDSGLAATDGAPVDPLVTFSTDLASWEIAVRDLLPRLVKHLEPRLAKLQAARHLAKIDPQALQKRPGSLTHVYEDDAGDEATVVLTVGGGGPNAARLRVTDTELWRLLEGGMRLSQLVASRVQVSGNVAYVLDLARAVEG